MGMNFPTSVWGIEKIKEYVTEHELEIDLSLYTEENKKTLIEEIKHLSKENLKTESSPDTEVIPIPLVKSVEVIRVRKCISFWFGTVFYSFEPNREYKVSKDVAIHLGNLGLLVK